MVQSGGSEGGVIVTGGEEGKATCIQQPSPPRTDPYHARGRHPVHASLPGRPRVRGFDDDFDGWVALYFRSIKRVSEKGTALLNWFQTIRLPMRVEESCTHFRLG